MPFVTLLENVPSGDPFAILRPSVAKESQYGKGVSRWHILIYYPRLMHIYIYILHFTYEAHLIQCDVTLHDYIVQILDH